MPWCTDELGHVQNPTNSKLLCTKTFMVFIWGIWRPIQHSHLKNHEFHFFTKLPTKPSTYVVVHRPTWPCAKPNQLKAFVHQDFHGIHLGAFGGQSNPHILKTTNFIFSQNSPPSHLAIPWPCAKPSELKTFVHQEFHGILLGTFGGLSNPHISKTTNFIFFTKLPTMQSSYAAVHRPTWPFAKPNQLKTFVHQDFHGIYLGAFGGQSTHHISKTTNFIFSQNSSPRHPAMPWCTDQIGHVQRPTNSKLLCTKTFMVFIWGLLEANPTLTSQKPRISFFHKTPHQAI